MKSARQGRHDLKQTFVNMKVIDQNYKGLFKYNKHFYWADSDGGVEPMILMEQDHLINIIVKQARDSGVEIIEVNDLDKDFKC